MSCSWESNRRSGIALAMHHRLQWFIHLRAYGLRKTDEHPAYTPHEVWHSLHLPYLMRKSVSIVTTGAVLAMKPEATAVGDPEDGRWKITLMFDGRRFAYQNLGILCYSR